MTRHVDINSIATDSEVFLLKVLSAFVDCPSVLRWEMVDGDVSFTVEFIPKAARQQITPANVDALLQAQADVRAADPTASPYWGPFLFCIREQGSTAERRYIPEGLLPLFKAARITGYA